MADFARPQGILLRKSQFERLLELGERLFPGVDLPLLAVQAISQAECWGERVGKIDALMVVWGLLTMCLHRELSIDEAFELCLSWKEGGDHELEQGAVTLNAFHNARKRLGHEPLALLLSLLASTLPSTIDPVIGKRLIALDSAKINVPDTEGNALAFGRARNGAGESKYPQLLLSALVSTYDRVVRHVEILPGSSDEHQGAFRFLDFLGPHDLLFVDRGIPSARFLKALLDKKISFAVRIPNNWDVTVLKTNGPGDHLVRLIRELKDEEKGTKETVTVEARLVEFQVGDEDVRILTTLVDAKQVPATTFCDLYHERWQIETAIGEVKNAIAAPRRGRSPLLVRSESPALVRQELYATLIVHVLVRNEGRRAAEYQGLEPRKLSFTRWFNSIRRLVHDSAPGSRRRVQLGAGSCRLPRRSREKRGRCYPRQVRQYQPKYKNRTSSYAQSYRTVTPAFATTARTMKGMVGRSP